MVTGYVYDAETREIVATITGAQAQVEEYVTHNYDLDTYGLTYTPNGLHETTGTEDITI